MLDPPSADLAAQTYRVGLFDREGPSVWDNHWYGGHHLPGYSVLFPPLGALLGLRLAGALSLVGATAAFAALAGAGSTRAPPAPPRPGSPSRMAATVVSGRLPFALGVAVGHGGAARRCTPAPAGRRRWAR